MAETLSDFYNLSVADFMSRQLVFVSPTDSIKKAIQIMAQKDIGALVVLDMENHTAIVTERDVITEISDIGIDLDAPIAEIMTVVPVSIDVDERLGVACQIMVGHGFRHLLIEEKNEIIGIISMRDIARALMENMPSVCLRKPRKKKKR